MSKGLVVEGAMAGGTAALVSVGMEDAGVAISGREGDLGGADSISDPSGAENIRVLGIEVLASGMELIAEDTEFAIEEVSGD